jgi:hypothetical protein
VSPRQAARRGGGDIAFEDERLVELKGLGKQAVFTVVAR